MALITSAKMFLSLVLGKTKIWKNSFIMLIAEAICTSQRKESRSLHKPGSSQLIKMINNKTRIWGKTWITAAKDKQLLLTSRLSRYISTLYTPPWAWPDQAALIKAIKILCRQVKCIVVADLKLIEALTVKVLLASVAKAVVTTINHLNHCFRTKGNKLASSN